MKQDRIHDKISKNAIQTLNREQLENYLSDEQQNYKVSETINCFKKRINVKLIKKRMC